MLSTIKSVLSILNKTVTEQNKLARGPYVVIATVVWEFFSYFGMCSLLILYLTQSLHFSDQYSYSLYGAYSSLTFLTPVIGGWLADNYLGNRASMILGAVLIMLGHFVLALTNTWSLYLGLSLLICGVGFFKASAICLIGEYYQEPSARNSAFIFYYMGGNIGAAIAPIACGYIAARYGWEYGFALAGVGMLCGLLTLVLFRQYLRGMGNSRVALYDNVGKLNLRLLIKYAVLLLILLAATMLVMVRLWDGYVVIATTIIAAWMVRKIYLGSDNKTRRGLWLGFTLTLFAILFWIFDQQGGSSISLFIERFIDRDIFLQLGSWSLNYQIPTAMFQAINPAVIVIFGALMAYGLKKFTTRRLALNSVTQVMLGIALLTVGFCIISLGAMHAEWAKIPMSWVISGLTFVSVAEIFIDPVILGVINKVAPNKSLTTLTAIYYLLVGAIANYLAAQVATWTAAPTAQANALLYKTTYEEVVYIGLGMIAGLLILRFSPILATKIRGNRLLS